MVWKSSFHIRRFYARVRKTLIDYYMIKTLFSEPPQSQPQPDPKKPARKTLVIKLDDPSVSPCFDPFLDNLRKVRPLSRGFIRKITKEVEIDVQDFQNTQEIEDKDDDEAENVSCWGMKILINCILDGKPPSYVNKDGKNVFIKNEKEAIDAANYLFNSVFPNPGGQISMANTKIQAYFAKRQEGKRCGWLYEQAGIPQLENTVDAQEIKEVFRECMVRAWRDRTSLIRALLDNKLIFATLNRYVNVALVLIIVVIWLIMVNKELLEVVLLVGSAIISSAVIFGECFRKSLDDFAFIFFKHPFDVGDCCLIEDTPVIIRRMNLHSTVAVTLDNEQKYYSNSFLKDKTITNYTRSPAHIGDSQVFYLKPEARDDRIEALRQEIKSEIFNENQHYWKPKHELAIEMESQPDGKTLIKATLRFKHKAKFYDLREKESRKTKLTTQLKSILDRVIHAPPKPSDSDPASTPSYSYPKQIE